MGPLLGLPIVKYPLPPRFQFSDEPYLSLIKVTNNELAAQHRLEMAQTSFPNAQERRVNLDTSHLLSQEIRVSSYPSPRQLLNHTALCILRVWMNSHTFDSRPSPSNSAGRIPSRVKSHSSPPRPESKPSSQRHSSPKISQPRSGIRRPHSTGTETIRSDGSWMAPEVLAWKRPHRSPRVGRSPVAPVVPITPITPERQVNHYNTFDTVHEEPAPQDQKPPTRRKGSDGSACGAGIENRGLSKRPDAPRDKPRQDVNHKVMEHRGRPEASHSALGADHNEMRPQNRGSGSRPEKLASLSKDFQNQLNNPLPNRCIPPGEEGMSSSFASQKVAQWLKSSRDKSERPHSASLTQALRFTALLAQAPLADAGLDNKIVPSRYNPQNRTSQGSRFMGC